jgi:hypothetical protein
MGRIWRETGKKEGDIGRRRKTREKVGDSGEKKEDRGKKIR